MARKVGSVYAEIRADIKNLQKDFDNAHKVTVAGAQKIQKTLDDGINFSKIAAGAAAAAASMYASFRSIGQAIEMAKVGSMLEKQSAAFENLATAAGKSSKELVGSLRTASKGMIADADLMAASGKALLMNIPADKISKLMEIAAATSRMTGQTMTEAFADITLGVARQSRMILDNLGIIVDVDAANEKYAVTLGKTASALTEAEKKQAFMNAVLSAGDDMIKRLGDSAGGLDGVNKLIAAQTGLWGEVQKTIAQILDNELSTYAKMIGWIDEKLKGMRATATTGGRESLQKEIDMLRSLEAKGMVQPGSTAAKEAEMYRRFNRGSFDAGEYNPKFNPPDIGGWRRNEGTTADFTEKELEIERKNQEAQREAWAKRDQSTVFGPSWSDYDDGLKVDLKAWEELKRQHQKQLEEMAQQADDSWTVQAKNQNMDIAEAVKRYEEANKRLTDVSQHTAEAMQDAMSDFFFDAMTGKLKTVEDYFRSFFESIARMASQMMAQQGMSKLMGMIGGSIGGGSAASLPINTLPNQPFHSGGVVGSSGGPMRHLPASFYHGAPRLHGGLMGDEYPAILQKGETVIPKGGMGGVGDTYYYISAMDTKSIVDSLRRSGAVPMLSEENIRGNGSLRRAIQTRAR